MKGDDKQATLTNVMDRRITAERTAMKQGSDKTPTRSSAVRQQARHNQREGLKDGALPHGGQDISSQRRRGSHDAIMKLSDTAASDAAASATTKPTDKSEGRGGKEGCGARRWWWCGGVEGGFGGGGYLGSLIRRSSDSVSFSRGPGLQALTARGGVLPRANSRFASDRSAWSSSSSWSIVAALSVFSRLCSSSLARSCVVTLMFVHRRKLAGIRHLQVDIRHPV